MISHRVTNPRRSRPFAVPALAMLLFVAPVDRAAADGGGKPSSRPTSRPAAKAAPAETEEAMAAAEAPETPAVMPAQGDAEALELAKAIMKAHGGMDGLKSMGQIAFDFVVEADGKERARRSHYWDPRTNEGVVAASGKNGEVAIVHFDDVWSAATATTESDFASDFEREAVFERARRQFINDSYWLLAPLKLMDDGVTLKNEGEVEFDGKKRLALRLSFAGVGVTPDDQYVFYVDPPTKLVVGWSYIGKDQEPSDFAWEAHELFGPMNLPLVKRSLSGPFAIRFENIEFGEGLIPKPVARMTEEELAEMAKAANEAHAAAAFDLEQVERDLDELERLKREETEKAEKPAETSPEAGSASAAPAPAAP